MELAERGRSVFRLAFPNRNNPSTGTLINHYLKGETPLTFHAAHLIFSANRWEHAAEIERLLSVGTTVILDRYVDSGIAFSVAAGLDLDWCRHADVGLPMPDVVFFLDLDPEEAETREGYGTERYENMDFQRKVRDAYHALRGPHWITIDASLDTDEIHDKVLAAMP